MIFDTSIRIDFIVGNVNPKSMLLKDYFDNGSTINICPCIVQEVLQGSKSVNQFLFLRDLMKGLTLLEQIEYEMSINAAQMYFQLRKKASSFASLTTASLPPMA